MNWRSFIFNLYSFALILFSYQSRTVAITGSELKFNKNSTFKIVQFADLHFGEDSWTEWGPNQDIKSKNVMESILIAEKPDFVVFSGDQITANNIGTETKNATKYWDQVVSVVQRHKIPWCAIIGNHDDMPLHPQSKPEFYTTRKELLQFDMSYNLSHTRLSSNNIFGVSNYVLYVKSNDGKKDIASILVMDSGGGSLPEQIDHTQVTWLNHQVEEIRKRTSGSSTDGKNSLAYMHIPTNEFVHAASIVKTNQNYCTGTFNESVSPAMETNSSIVEILADSNLFVSLNVGHNHGNDSCCPYSGKSSFHICYGRHSGYGGYGTWNRGARVIQMTHIQKSFKVEFESWIRMEDGSIQNFQNLTTIESSTTKIRRI